MDAEFAREVSRRFRNAPSLPGQSAVRALYADCRNLILGACRRGKFETVVLVDSSDKDAEGAIRGVADTLREEGYRVFVTIIPSSIAHRSDIKWETEQEE